MGAQSRKAIWVAALGALLAALAIAPSAHAAVLYDQTDHPGTQAGSHIASTSFADSPVFTSEGADDFTVPAGQTWQITQVDVDGYTQGIPPTTAHVYLYRDFADAPGPAFFDAPGLAESGAPNYSIPISGAPNLDPGHYWLSVQEDGSFSDNYGEWWWQTRTVQSGDPSMWENWGGGLGTGCAVYTVRGTCGSSAMPSEPDFLFKLSGNLVVPPSPPTDASTGQRAAALKSCPKKKSKKARKKCRQRANKLPV